jgi:hypothetical protein
MTWPKAQIVRNSRSVLLVGMDARWPRGAATLDLDSSFTGTKRMPDCRVAFASLAFWYK